MALSRGLQRRLATGVNAVLVGIFVVAIVAVLVEVASQQRQRFDVTEDGAASLLPDTLAVLKQVDEQQVTVRVTAFSAQRKGKEAWYKDRTVRDLLRELEYVSPNVRTRFVDFDRDRMTAESLGVDRYGTIVVEGRDDRVDIVDREVFRRQRGGVEAEFAFLGEGAVTRAIRQILADRTRTLYVLAGHGEREAYDRGQGELQVLGGHLDDQGWTVRTLDLLRDRGDGPPTVPADAAAVLLLGPKAPLSPQEDAVLASWVEGGGSLGVFVDPRGVRPDLLGRFGLDIGTGVVLDTVAIFPHADRPLLRYKRHPITQANLEDNVATVVAHAAPVTGEAGQPLLVTSPKGWVERGSERPAVYTAGEDDKGPVTVARAVELGTGRLLVVGDSDLVTDELLREGPGNAGFVVNSLRWLVRADDRIAPVGRPTHVRKLALSTAQLSMIRWLVMGGIPLFVVLLGGVVWTFRRGR